MVLQRLGPSTNGFVVRLVGRCRINDGLLHLLLDVLLMPLTLLNVFRARRARNSWNEVKLQLFSFGCLPQVAPEELHASPSLLSIGPKAQSTLRFVCISDTHLQHQSLEPLPRGDVLVHCGDCTNHGSLDEVLDFAAWFGRQPHSVKLLVPGNHDMILHKEYYDKFWGDWSTVKESHSAALEVLVANGIRMLVDETMEVQGIRIHGSPWVTRYAKWETAFNKTDEDMAKHWLGLPGGLDVLLTHTPPYGFGDRNKHGAHAGCPHLALRIEELCPRFHVFGHVHSDHGIMKHSGTATTYVNASSVCDYYRVGNRHAIVFDVPCSPKIFAAGAESGGASRKH